MDNGNSRSVFWPVVLIVIGLIWLLGNLTVLPPFNFSALLDLWPLALIVVGINMIIGRRWPVLRATIAILAIGGALAYAYVAPSLGFVPAPEIQHAEFEEPLGDARSATIQIGSSIGRTTLTALNDSSNLFEASVDYIGEIDFKVEGEADKTIRLNVENDQFNTDFIDAIDTNELEWVIGISPEVPIVLDFSSGVGEIVLDLSGLTLASVHIKGGVGQTELILPAQDGVYAVRVDSGVGELSVEIEDGAAVDLTIDGGVGNITIDVPQTAGVSVRADLGVGSISVPGGFETISGGASGIGNSGTWESENYATADYKIEIDFDGGVGSLTIK